MFPRSPTRYLGRAMIPLLGMVVFSDRECPGSGELSELESRIKSVRKVFAEANCLLLSPDHWFDDLNDVLPGTLENFSQSTHAQIPLPRQYDTEVARSTNANTSLDVGVKMVLCGS